MGYGFRVRMEGDYALFTRPELKVERYTYDVMTPGAARGILEAICWKPAIRYVIDRIHVLKPIQVMNIRRNEVLDKGEKNKVFSAMGGRSGPLYISAADSIVQRASLILRDVSYAVDAHFEMTDKRGENDTADKFYSMIRRRVQNGQCFHQPYFGCREFPVRFSLMDDEPIETAYPGQERDLGLMLYDMDYSDSADIKPTYFRAMLKDGVMDLTDCEVIR